MTENDFQVLPRGFDAEAGLRSGRIFTFSCLGEFTLNALALDSIIKDFLSFSELYSELPTYFFVFVLTDCNGVLHVSCVRISV